MLADKGESKMQIDNYLKSDTVESDELGRIILKDLSLLEAINGAIGDNPGFMSSDVGCGNSNCVC